MTISLEELERFGARGKVLTNGGEKIGSIGQIYLDDQTGEPEWVTVKTGLFGTAESFAPLHGARIDGDDVVVGYDKDTIKTAPRVEADGSLSPEAEQALYRHYRLGTNAGSNDAMTRSEERLRVGTQKVESGRVRLRKHVVTEQVSQTVPVRKEQVRLEREPITDANRGAALSGPAISEEEHEVVLHEEVPVVQKETVPVERVRLDTTVVTGQETVSADVRKEQIEVDNPETKGTEKLS